MTQYDERVERQRQMLAAEEWAKIPKSVHVHKCESMWYETSKSKKDLKNGHVTDIQYYGGQVVRSQNGKDIRTFGKKLVGEELLRAWGRHHPNV